MHHMQVDLEVAFPSMEIVASTVVFESHPHVLCPSITPHYEKLVGLSIARGFTHKVRELFGGPRGCTHTTALLQAMAPVAIQSTWSMRVGGDGSKPVSAPRQLTPEERREQLRFNLNTCHVWAEDGELMAKVDRGEEVEPPQWAERRLRQLGRDPAEWRPRMSGE